MNGHPQPNGTAMPGPGGETTNATDFLTLFCEKFGCDPRKFKKCVFVECVHPEGQALARCLHLFRPRLFERDLDLIERVKNATSFTQIERLVDYEEAKYTPEGLVRLVLKARVSKKRLLALAQTLFSRSV
jgi:hypothetical protein